MNTVGLIPGYFIWSCTYRLSLGPGVAQTQVGSRYPRGTGEAPRPVHAQTSSADAASLDAVQCIPTGTCDENELIHYALTSKLSLTEMRRYKH